jgi:hypothetical protein
MKSIEIEKLGGELVDTYDHPEHIGENDWMVSLYVLPSGNYALATNGAPIFEDDKHWNEAKEVYGF